jgi:hypothetical protein
MGMEPGTLATLSVRTCLYGLFRFAAAVRRCLEFLRATAFWGTILLPFVILGALVTDVATREPLLIVALLGLNVVCIGFGRRYRPGE